MLQGSHGEAAKKQMCEDKSSASNLRLKAIWNIYIVVSKCFWSTSKSKKCIKPLYITKVKQAALACPVCKC